MTGLVNQYAQFTFTTNAEAETKKAYRRLVGLKPSEQPNMNMKKCRNTHRHRVHSVRGACHLSPHQNHQKHLTPHDHSIMSGAGADQPTWVQMPRDNGTAELCR